MSDTPLNLAGLPARDWELWLDGYTHGYADGIPVGRRHEREETTALMCEAVGICRAMADVPVRDAEEDRRQAERRAAWWAERRGEVA